MRYIFTIAVIVYAYIGCENKKLSPSEIVTNYYNARAAANYTEVKNCLNDSLTVTEGDYIMSYDLDGFYEVFKWDSIFQPAYEIVKLKEDNDQVIATVALGSIRNSFLKNNRMICRYKITFVSNKISDIESLDCDGADWKIWGEKRDALVQWISDNHPELNGFIHDMTMKGAQNYLKAIALYEAYKKAL